MLNRISFERGESYIETPKYLRSRKATINPKNNDDKCSQYVFNCCTKLSKT